MHYREIFENDTPSIVHVYRGAPNGYQHSTFGVFFTNLRSVATRYNNHVIEADLDISNALHWTAATSADFQNYVAQCRQKRYSPPGTSTALKLYNQRNDADFKLADAIGYLLRERPAQVGHHELDPLMGYVRQYLRDHGKDVIIRDHDSGGGMVVGKEYIVFDTRRVQLTETFATHCL